jgi:hypothetical protein
MRNGVIFKLYLSKEGVHELFEKAFAFRMFFPVPIKTNIREHERDVVGGGFS